MKSDGLAFLHTGEAVLTAEQNKAGGGGITINSLTITIAGNSTRDQAKALLGELQQLGMRYQR